MKNLHNDPEINFNLNTILKSTLSDKIKIPAIDLITKNVDVKKGQFNYPEFKESIDKLKLLEEDLNNVNIYGKTLEMIIYNIVSRHCYKNEELGSSLFYEFFDNEEFRNKIRHIEYPQSGIIFFLKGLSDEIDQLNKFITEKKYYLVLKKHQEINNFCLQHGIESNILEDKNELYLEKLLSKHFREYSTFKNPYQFKKNIDIRLIREEENNFKHLVTGTLEGYYVQKILHEKMLNHFKDTRCATYIYDRNINVYQLNNLTIVAYRYDDIPKMVLRNNDMDLNWNDSGFWAVVFDDKVKFVKEKNTNYYKTNGITYKVFSKTFNNEDFYNLSNQVIFVPEDNIDEAVYLYLTRNQPQGLDLFTASEYKSLGFDFSKDSNIMTGDYTFFFKNPSLVDELNVENIQDYSYLVLFSQNKTQESRNRTIGQIKAVAKTKPKNTVDRKPKTKTKRNILTDLPIWSKPVQKIPKKYWTPYKDD